MDRNGTSPISEVRRLFWIFKVIRRAGPDVVFSYTIKNNIYSGIACRGPGIPFVPNVTGLGPMFNATGLLNLTVRALYRVAFGKARAVFFQNSSEPATWADASLLKRLTGYHPDTNIRDGIKLFVAWFREYYGK